MSLTYSGIFVVVAGSFLVNYLGISDACSSEITSKVVEWAPVVAGSAMAVAGRFRIGNKVAALRDQISTLGHMPRA